MNPISDCTSDCPLHTACTEKGQCLHDSGLVSIAEALCHFEREAVQGVCDTGRYRCRYYTWGAGPPLVFVHGIGDSSRAFVPPISLLSRHFRCIAYDLPTGRGDGARLSRYRHADLVADLLALLDHLDIRRSYLYGSSFGSTIALAALHQAPERLPRAILQGGFAQRALRRKEWALAWLGSWLPGELRHLPAWIEGLRRVHQPPFVGRSSEAWDYLVSCIGGTAIRTLAQHALLLHGVDLRPILPAVRQPLLLVTGDADPLVGRECEEVLLQGLPNARRVEIAGCGHLPYHTHPEVLAELITAFLTPPL